MESSEQTTDIQLPPGFRFHPSDEELIVHYLRNKVVSRPFPANIITEIHLYKYDPWELPGKAAFGEDEWFFFTPRDRKYPNGTRPNRAAGTGYWKATGTDKHILTSCGTKSIGVKKALVFYTGRPPKGIKTAWIMNEYRLLDTIFWTSKRKGCMRLDDWVLCRIRHKSNNPKSNWKGLTNSSGTDGPTSQFQRVDDEPCSNKSSANPNLEMVRDYFYKDCPMLPYIFSSQELPSMEKSSSTSLQSSKDTKPSTWNKKNNDHDQQAKCSVSVSDSLMLNPLKRKPNCRENDYESNDLLLGSKRIISNGSDHEKTKEANFSVVNCNSSAMNFWDVEQSQADAFKTVNHHWTSSNLPYQELSPVVFAVCD